MDYIQTTRASDLYAPCMKVIATPINECYDKLLRFLVI
jgi:hypothetical protein